MFVINITFYYTRRKKKMLHKNHPRYKPMKGWCDRCHKKFQRKTRGEKLCEKCWEIRRKKK
jgi:Zn finger protein HypA/HybF involved in hydrogenase expression